MPDIPNFRLKVPSAKTAEGIYKYALLCYALLHFHRYFGITALFPFALPKDK